MHSGDSDEALMLAYRGGDGRAFERLVARFEKPVWNYLRRFVADATTAEDLLQEVFLRVVKSADDPKSDWRGMSKLSTWLYSIARNLCVDQARRAVHRDASSLDEPAHAGGDADATMHDRIASHHPAADALVADRQLKVRIDRAIAALPADQREVFLLREVMEMPFAEIAAIIGTSEATVKSRMRYALEKLRAALLELGTDGSGAGQSAGSRSA